MNTTTLVIGATGNVGKELVKILANHGHPVRATVRSTTRTDELKSMAVETVVADIGDRSALKAAMSGIEKVFFVTPAAPQMMELSSNIIQAAKDTGVKHLVKLSGADADLEAVTLTKWHRAVEKEIERSGIAHTFLRPNSFMQNIVNFNSQTIKDHGTFYAPMGDQGIALIDARDIAKVAFHVLTTVGHENKAYYLSGLSAISYSEIADILSSVIGKPVRYVDVPDDMARQAMLDAGTPGVIVDAIMELNHLNKLGKAASVSSAVEEITGQKATSFERFVRDYKSAFIG